MKNVRYNTHEFFPTGVKSPKTYIVFVSPEELWTYLEWEAAMD